MKKRDPKLNRKYRLHMIAKRFGKVDSLNRTVYINHSFLNNALTGHLMVLGELHRDYGYNIQYEI